MSRVLLLVRRLWNGGGTETYVYTLAKELERMGHFVGVFTSGGPWVSYFRSKGIRVHISPTYSRTTFLKQIIQQNHYTVIHAQDTFSFYLVRKLQNKRNLRIVFTIHGRYVQRNTLIQCAPAANAVIAVSPSLQDYVVHCGVSLQKIHLIPNGISSNTFHPANVLNSTRRTNFRLQYGIPQGAFVVGYAGRFTFDKAILSKRISSILCTFANTYPNTWVFIAGRHSKAIISPTQKCVILGHVSNMENFYHACDAIVGTARVALESLACAKPTIAVGYARYIGILHVTHLHSAYYSNFGDHSAVRSSWATQKLLRDLAHIRSNPGFYQAHSLLLSQAVRTRYSASSMVHQILQLY